MRSNAPRRAYPTASLRRISVARRASRAKRDWAVLPSADRYGGHPHLQALRTYYLGVARETGLRRRLAHG